MLARIREKHYFCSRFHANNKMKGMNERYKTNKRKSRKPMNKGVETDEE